MVPTREDSNDWWSIFSATHKATAGLLLPLYGAYLW